MKVGTYDLLGDGFTDDFWHHGFGENCDEGGSEAIDSNSDGILDVHSGELPVDGFPASDDMAGEVHLVRLGTVMLLDGPLYEGSLDVPDPKPAMPDHWFQAELEVIPLDGDCESSPVENWALMGTFEMFLGVSLHDCSLDGTLDDSCSP